MKIVKKGRAVPLRSVNTINRDISWLAFNERVLQEAADVSNPLIERFRFLGIYSNNLDEFFRVRVGNVKRLIHRGEKSVPYFKGSPKDLLDKIKLIVLDQQVVFENTFKQLCGDLALEGQVFWETDKLSVEQRRFLWDYFQNEVLHEIVPVILSKTVPFPKLRDKAVYLAVRISSQFKRDYALIEIPGHVQRFVQFPNEYGAGVLWIDDLIRLHLDSIFTLNQKHQLEAYTFKFTRDADLFLDDDVSVSLEEKMVKGLKNRKKGNPVRFVHDSSMPFDLLEFLIIKMNLGRDVNIIPGGKYHNFKDLIQFPDFNKSKLVFEPFASRIHPAVHGKKRMFNALLKEEILLHFPFDSFNTIVDLLRESAIDPKVKSIKINVYRLANRSQIMNALINAKRNGKHVLVVMELQARFDEEHNLFWARRLKEEGIQVLVGDENRKIHSKLLLIHRVENGISRFLSYIGTGNFNESTSTRYTDLGFITPNLRIAREVEKVFEMYSNPLLAPKFKFLLVSPLNQRIRLKELIKTEIRNAEQGIRAGISLKINNLTDQELVDLLLKASRSGVKVRLIVRGMCVIVSSSKDPLTNLEIISVVDRFLEHTRFVVFENNGNPRFLLSSADWMTRNMDFRFEVGVEIFSKKIQKELRELFETYWNANSKTRILTHKKKLNTPRKVDEDSLSAQQYLMQKNKSSD
jgi:polyphosphate kinase